MANKLNPIPILAVLFLLKSRGGSVQHPLPSVSPLQLESLLDNAHTMLHTLEKLGGLAQAGSQVSLPDMKKMMEIVEKIPL